MDLIQLILLTLLGGLLITLLVFFLQTTNFTKKSGSNSKLQRPTFLVLGLNYSGKTALYYKLFNDSQGKDEEKLVNTISSIEPNIAEINLPFSSRSISKKYQLIDYPGHLKYSQLLNKLILEDITLKKIKGIVYVIDSSSNSINQQQQIKLISKFLFNLFAQTEKLINGIDFLFAINKQDLFDAKPVFKIKQLLEDEISKLIHDELNERENKNSGIDKGEEEDDEDIDNYESLREFWLSVVGGANKKFKFEVLEGNMDFIGGSILKNKVEQWENWFDEKVVNQ